MVTKLLKKFTSSLEKKLEEEKKKNLIQITELKKNDPFSDPDHVSDNADIDTDTREQIGHDTIEAQIKDLQRRTDEIDLALKKINKGNYGNCEKCHQAIPQPRLNLIPEARYCIDCEKKIRK